MDAVPVGGDRLAGVIAKHDRLVTVLLVRATVPEKLLKYVTVMVDVAAFPRI